MVGERGCGGRLDSIWQFLHVLVSCQHDCPGGHGLWTAEDPYCCSRTHGSTRRVSADGCRCMLLQARGAAGHGGSMFKPWAALAGSRPLQSVEVSRACWGLLLPLNGPHHLDSSMGVRGRPGMAGTSLKCEANPQ